MIFYSLFQNQVCVRMWLSGLRSHIAVIRHQHRQLSLLRCSRATNLTSQPSLYVHTTQSLPASRPGNTKKKLIRVSQLKSSKKREVVTIWPGMTVSELAETMGHDTDHVFEAFLYVDNSEHYDSPNSVIDDELVIQDVVKKSGFRFRYRERKKEVIKEDKDAYRREIPEGTKLTKRPPVVTIMGHVDHGKTTLLDALRHSNVVDSEFGGITQHIGAFSVKMPSGDNITFLDTPGHAAFSAMRSRGAHITDIVVLVIAADDGVMKQTEESIKYAQNANVPILVAINKIDRPMADIDYAKRGLYQFGIQLEEDGGDVQAVPISALKRTNLDKLQEAIVALSEILELKSDAAGLVEGVVVESHTDPGRGKVSTALIQQGTLKKGAHLVAGLAKVKVKAMFNEKGRPLRSVSPGMPVEIIGWKELPSAGDTILQVESEARANEVIRYRQDQAKQKMMETDQEVIAAKSEAHRQEYSQLRSERLEKGYKKSSIYRRMRTKETEETSTTAKLSILIKGDVDGSVEAILDMIGTYNDPRCELDLLNFGVGNVVNADIDLAASFNGIIYAFNTNLADKVFEYAASNNVEIRHHNIIYKLYDDLKEELNERIPMSQEEEILGEAVVLANFTVSQKKKKVQVAGCRCIKGLLQKKEQFRLMRGEEVVYEGPLSSLKHLKNEVESIKNDVECGLSFEDTDIVAQPQDTIVCFKYIEVKEAVNWDLNF